MIRLLLSPRLVGFHLLALVATTAAVWLGVWQYDAWQASRAAEATDLASAEPVLLDDVMSSDDPFPGDAVGAPVQFDGRWLEDAGFLVAGRELEGRTGYWVVTPVAVCRDLNRCARATGPAMPVVRGWTSRPGDIPAPRAGRVQVTGWLQPPEDSGRSDPNPDDDVLQEVRIADAIQRVEQDLYGAYVIAEVPAPTALEPVTPESLPEPDAFGAVRNLLYAFEWWVFGAFALFAWWRWCRDELERVSTGSTGRGIGEQGGEDSQVTEVASVR